VRCAAKLWSTASKCSWNSLARAGGPNLQLTLSRVAKGSSFGAREQGRYAAEFYTTVKTAYTLA